MKVHQSFIRRQNFGSEALKIIAFFMTIIIGTTSNNDQTLRRLGCGLELHGVLLKLAVRMEILFILAHGLVKDYF